MPFRFFISTVEYAAVQRGLSNYWKVLSISDKSIFEPNLSVNFVKPKVQNLQLIISINHETSYISILKNKSNRESTWPLRPVYMDWRKPLPGRSVTLSAESPLAGVDKLDPFARANSVLACSDFLALTKLNRMGGPEYWATFARRAGSAL